MSGYLDHVVSHATGQEPVLGPRPRSRFESHLAPVDDGDSAREISATSFEHRTTHTRSTWIPTASDAEDIGAMSDERDTPLGTLPGRRAPARLAPTAPSASRSARPPRLHSQPGPRLRTEQDVASHPGRSADPDATSPRESTVRPPSVPRVTREAVLGADSSTELDSAELEVVAGASSGQEPSIALSDETIGQLSETTRRPGDPFSVPSPPLPSSAVALGTGMRDQRSVTTSGTSRSAVLQTGSGRRHRDPPESPDPRERPDAPDDDHPHGDDDSNGDYRSPGSDHPNGDSSHHARESATAESPPLSASRHGPAKPGIHVDEAAPWHKQGQQPGRAGTVLPVNGHLVTAGEDPRSEFRAANASDASRPPVINVTIGRVEVRSPQPAPMFPEPAPPADPGPRPLSLDDYLDRRDRL